MENEVVIQIPRPLDLPEYIIEMNTMDEYKTNRGTQHALAFTTPDVEYNQGLQLLFDSLKLLSTKQPVYYIFTQSDNRTMIRAVVSK